MKKNTSKVGDNVKNQFRKSLETDVIKHAEKVAEFDLRQTRLGDFLFFFEVQIMSILICGLYGNSFLP